jgi:hypothetical protein
VNDEEVISENPGYQLNFSTDTVAFDTVFTSIGSVTKRFIVRNQNPNALIIDNIYVGKGNDSPYSITVSGNESNRVENQQILGNDSLLVLVTVKIDPSDESLPFIVRDSVVFITNGNVQDVKLQSWGQNAHFLGNTVLDCDTQWSSDLPYFLYGSILIDTLCALQVEKNVRVFSSFDTYVFVKGSVQVRGEPDARVVFRNERLEPEYENIPGQWGGFIFLEGSNNNLLEYTDIRNVQYGIRLGTPDSDSIPDIILNNVRIENSAVAGIAAFNSDLLAENTLINTSTGYVVGNFAGGYYTYNHCTIANFPVTFFSGNAAYVSTDNLDLEDGSNLYNPLNIFLLNTIVWGNLEEEIILDLSQTDQSRIKTQNSILKTSLNIFEGDGTFLSTETDFMQFKDIYNYDYTPDSLSPAINNALGSEMEYDLFGLKRDSLPDIGAIEYLLNN